MNKKENLRWLSLKIEADNINSNSDHFKNELKKITDSLNREIYKKLRMDLKKQMQNWDNEALLKYTQLINQAKKMGLK